MSRQIIEPAGSAVEGSMPRNISRVGLIAHFVHVPLNSSKITSSMRLPVSTCAVAMMVSEPPSSMLRAAPKKRFGRGYRDARAIGHSPSPPLTAPHDLRAWLTEWDHVVAVGRRAACAPIDDGNGTAALACLKQFVGPAQTRAGQPPRVFQVPAFRMRQKLPVSCITLRRIIAAIAGLPSR
jgi:hypothetical protein